MKFSIPCRWHSVPNRAGRTPPGVRRAILLLWVLHKPLLWSSGRTQLHFVDSAVLTASGETSSQRAVAKLALPFRSSTQQLYQAQSLGEKAKWCCVKSIQAHLSCFTCCLRTSSWVLISSMLFLSPFPAGDPTTGGCCFFNVSRRACNIKQQNY